VSGLPGSGDVFGDATVREAVDRYFELWETAQTPLERVEAIGLNEEDFLSVCDLIDACARRARRGSPEWREVFTVLTALGIGRQLGIVQATEAVGS
jgi:hypothetical protein